MDPLAMGYTPVLLASNLPYIRLDPSWVGDFPWPETVMRKGTADVEINGKTVGR